MTTEQQDTLARPWAARIATEVLAPWVWVLALPLLVAWPATGHRLGPTLLWGLVVGVTGAVIPMLVILRGAKAGRYDTHHVHNLEGRTVPLLLCLASLSTGWLILFLGQAPHQLISLAAAMFVSLLACAAITLGARWKISLHAAVAAGAVVMLVLSYGPWLWPAALLAAWVMWSRVALRDHTTGQVLVGAAVGILAGGGGYLGLELLLT
ncbi:MULTISPECIES: phosphatase PAP2 family protein [unclassified Crossiella]|uniref:phosphatase PAP2 family protein n=1 Tax=unclassified Crossiella TaxID=2620835 RepID=UPI001FFFA5A6|nr:MULTISPECIES: phosphatase PAP2 family protein [unclassified Crossiella]MCK2236365.1 phosphatase PAP2 family protein [Crossiella sp. S99.2]MCK2250032.1 phosphatase PAP2 family protein [Crossiella sp. S99.1]